MADTGSDVVHYLFKIRHKPFEKMKKKKKLTVGKNNQTALVQYNTFSGAQTYVS